MNAFHPNKQTNKQTQKKHTTSLYIEIIRHLYCQFNRMLLLLLLSLLIQTVKKKFLDVLFFHYILHVEFQYTIFVLDCLYTYIYNPTNQPNNNKNQLDSAVILFLGQIH